MLNRMKKAISLLALLALLLLTACSKSSDIKNGKVKSVKASVVSTSHDNSSFFMLIPIVVSAGKTTTITYIPVWNDIKYLTVEYTYRKKIYKTKTDDFDVEEYKGKPYIKIAKSDIGKKNASLVLYTHDK